MSNEDIAIVLNVLVNWHDKIVEDGKDYKVVTVNELATGIEIYAFHVAFLKEKGYISEELLATDKATEFLSDYRLTNHRNREF